MYEFFFCMNFGLVKFSLASNDLNFFWFGLQIMDEDDHHKFKTNSNLTFNSSETTFSGFSSICCLGSSVEVVGIEGSGGMGFSSTLEGSLPSICTVSVLLCNQRVIF